jgi:hypothetical protein
VGGGSKKVTGFFKILPDNGKKEPFPDENQQPPVDILLAMYNVIGLFRQLSLIFVKIKLIRVFCLFN